MKDDKIFTKYPGYKTFQLVDSMQFYPQDGWDLLEIIPAGAQKVESQQFNKEIPPYTDSQGAYHNGRFETVEERFILNVTLFLLGKKEESRIQELLEEVQQERNKIHEIERKDRERKEEIEKIRKEMAEIERKMGNSKEYLEAEKSRNADLKKEVKDLKAQKKELSEQAATLEQKLSTFRELIMNGSKEVSKESGETRDLDLD